MGGEVNYDSILRQAREREADARKILYAVKQPGFRETYVRLENTIKEKLKEAINQGNFETLRDLFKQYKQNDLYFCGIRELRERARKLYITNYSRMTKANLIMEIEHYERQTAALVKRVDRPTDSENQTPEGVDQQT